MISVIKENCDYSLVYWLCRYCMYFYRRSSWFIFQCWTGKSSESGGQTTSSEQKREGCYASGLDAEQIQEIVSTLSILTHHHAQLMLKIWLFILCYLFIQSCFYVFVLLPEEYYYNNKNIWNKLTKQSCGTVW